ncbi:MAG: methyltransferase domain-containing protein [Nostoc sp. NMS2]|uniref:methyltransferase domain-containing protein n=1 Tax=Nostoc sp. NMS2 TaxID=2815389 RepID=UPI0025E69349|nr:methyltransferase domain-containing protein [Nostoc sp. NMS2]MBN3992905.1 methyltransferase domain-containing protein [Nostoc sp. NMS2]
MSISFIPWWAKITAKVVLSRLPIEYKFWKDIGLFSHGYMEQPNYAYGVFKKHFDRAKPKAGFVSLEIGPGDSLFSAMISLAFGGSKSYLVDAKAFANKNILPYHAMAEYLEQKTLTAPNFDGLQSLEEILDSCHAEYMIFGLSSLKLIPDKSIDFIWSHAVLEHIRCSEFSETMKELRRIIRDDGVCSHGVDLRDHLGGHLNNLRFSERIWEGDFMANSGFYTNRIQYSQMVNIFKKAGFNVELIEMDRWNSLPTARSKLSHEFTHLSDEELCISTFSVVLKPV